MPSVLIRSSTAVAVAAGLAMALAAPAAAATLPAPAASRPAAAGAAAFYWSLVGSFPTRAECNATGAQGYDAGAFIAWSCRYSNPTRSWDLYAVVAA